MRLTRWYRAISQPLRWAVAGALMVAAVGAGYGVVESLRDYPISSWFGVVLYVGSMGAIAGFVLGLIAGTLRRLLSGDGAR